MFRQFNPQDVQRYYGKTFVTESGSEYGLTQDGKFTGRPSIEGSEVTLIAGIKEEYSFSVLSCLDASMPELKKRLDSLILEEGEKIKPGLRLVVSLTPESIEKTNRHGMITSTISKITQQNDK